MIKYAEQCQGKPGKKRSWSWILDVLSAGIILIAVIVIGFLVFGFLLEMGPDTIDLEGNGTIRNPYLIKSLDDLELMAVQVNSGNEFKRVWFRQEADLDFNDFGNWTPIGQYGSGNMFCGVYDGNGHSIQNITIDGNLLENQNVGLFGLLAGTVCNLKIENGTIIGAYIGTVASHGTENACIVNCSVSASLKATGRCGGIADNLGQGKIICCISDVEMECENPNGIGGVCSYDASVYDCYSTVPPLSAEFRGSDYHTQETEGMYLGIGETNLDRAKEVFPEELRDLPLTPLGLRESTLSVSG